jgi:sugar/nucleoside kinase (ribokinase family)
MTSVRVCGNLTIDEIAHKSGVSVSPGGSALFASAAASYLGSRVAIVGNVGEDYPPSNLRWLTAHGVDVRALKKLKGPSTRFRITHPNGSRRLTMIAKGSPIRTPIGLGTVEGTHLGPVFNEISTSLATSLRARSRFLSVDLQGFIRTTGPGGLVTRGKRKLDRLLKMCDMVQASMDEAKSQSPSGGHHQLMNRFLEAGPCYCVLTLGDEGSILGIWPDQSYLVPAFPDKSITDTTGAGDVFAGSWLSSYLSTRDPVWAAAVGSAFASLASRKTGLSKFDFEEKELMRRAGWVYNRMRPVLG